MAFKIGKFFSRVVSGGVKNAPALLAAYAGGGPGGLALAGLSSIKLRSGGGGGAAATPASFVQPSASFPGSGGAGGMGSGGGNAILVGNSTGTAIALTKDVYTSLLKIAGKLGVTIKNPNSVVRIGRNLLAKLLRFTRATPGLTILSMLLNLGLTAMEANTVISWYSTAGKKHKRIRVTNVKALNRSVRRLEGFRRLASRVEKALAHRGISRSSRVTRRCRKCRKSPCGC